MVFCGCVDGIIHQYRFEHSFLTILINEYAITNYVLPFRISEGLCVCVLSVPPQCIFWQIKRFDDNLLFHTFLYDR